MTYAQNSAVCEKEDPSEGRLVPVLRSNTAEIVSLCHNQDAIRAAMGGVFDPPIVT